MEEIKDVKLSQIIENMNIEQIEKGFKIHDEYYNIDIIIEFDEIFKMYDYFFKYYYHNALGRRDGIRYIIDIDYALYTFCKRIREFGLKEYTLINKNENGIKLSDVIYDIKFTYNDFKLILYSELYNIDTSITYFRNISGMLDKVIEKLDAINKYNYDYDYAYYIFIDKIRNLGLRD